MSFRSRIAITAALAAAIPSTAHAQDGQPDSEKRAFSRPSSAIFVDLSAGPASYGAIGAAFGGGAGLHARYAFVQAGINGSLAEGRDGSMSAAGLELGAVVRYFGGVDIALLGLAGRRHYADVGKISSSAWGIARCSGVSGFDGSTTFLGARLDIMRAMRDGPSVPIGVSFYYTRDLSTEHFAREGSDTCSGIFSSGSSPRHVDATIGGYEVGVAFKVGLGTGF